MRWISSRVISFCLLVSTCVSLCLIVSISPRRGARDLDPQGLEVRPEPCQLKGLKELELVYQAAHGARPEAALAAPAQDGQVSSP